MKKQLSPEDEKRIKAHLDAIEEICGDNFCHLPDEYDDFGSAWEMYSLNTIAGFSGSEPVEDYLKSITVDDFIDWVMCSF